MKVSGSKLALLPHCAYYARPDVTWDRDEAGDAARFGNVIHTLAEWHLRDRPTPIDEAMALHGVDDAERPRVVRVWAQALDYTTTHRRLGWRPEVALAWDVRADTARELASTGHRDYSTATEDEVCSTADVVTMDGDVAEVRDWKTGQSSLDSYEAQAAILSLAWARVTDAERARAVFTRFSDDGEPEERVWTFDALALDAISQDFAMRLLAAKALATQPQPGPHCSDLYCPARASCPATLSVVRSNEDLAPLAALVQTAITTPAQAGEAYRKLRLVKDAVKVVEDQIKRVVADCGSAPTAPGKAIRIVSQTRETFSKDRIPPERRDDVLRELRDLGALSLSASTFLREGKA